MANFRFGRDFHLYLILICCGLFFICVYYFHDYGPLVMTLFTQISESKSTSSARENHSRNDGISAINSNLLLQINKSKKSFTTKNVRTKATVRRRPENDFEEEQFPTKFSKSESRFHPIDKNFKQSRFGEPGPNMSDPRARNTQEGNIRSWKTRYSETSFNLSADLDLLSNILEEKLSAVTVRKIKYYKPTCNNKFKLANSCDKKCLRTQLPDDLSARISQLIRPRELGMNPREHEILRDMAEKVKSSADIILLTAASSNHFLESQALLKNLHENVYPFLKNFTLVFYNLGLTKQERALMVKYCRCQVVDFPFHKFPNFMRKLKCYSWKPVLIKSHLQKSNVVFWMDASIRFRRAPSHLQELIETTRKRGIQIGVSSAESAFRTNRSMYHFFGDEPCAYLNLCQGKATFGLYHREHFVERVILEPWVACALSEDCMCPRNRSACGCEDSKAMDAKYKKGKGPIVYGMCHRFDQSAISLILHKLYQDLYRWVMVSVKSVLNIRRRHIITYFPKG